MGGETRDHWLPGCGSRSCGRTGVGRALTVGGPLVRDKVGSVPTYFTCTGQASRHERRLGKYLYTIWDCGSKW